MNDHIATHFFKTIHVCNICDYKAETKRRLIRHAQRIHGIIDSFWLCAQNQNEKVTVFSTF